MMKIHILDKTLEYENNMSAYDKISSYVDDLINKSNLIFSHLIIDGVEIYQDYYDYFLDNIKNIEEVIVITKTIKEMYREIILSTVDYIERALPQVEILSNEFYKTPSKDSWAKLTDLIDGIKWIMDTFMMIDNNKQLKDLVNSYEEWNQYAKDIYSLKELLLEFEDVLENSDYVSIADILSYELIPLFKEMKDKLEKVALEEVEVNNA